MEFAKAHGTGNDFVIVPDADGALDLTPALVAAICDRRRGIGADGLLRVVRSAKHPDAAGMAGAAEWFMDYRNQDGSVAAMCGNGVRAYARYLVERGLVAGTRFPIATRAGIVEVEVGPEVISADMPVPEVTGGGSVSVAGRSYTGVTVTAGNPNLVVTLADTAALAALDLSRPPDLDPGEFPEGANVAFVVESARQSYGGRAYADSEPSPHTVVDMRVSERGVGETLSCGSGACAVAAATLRAHGMREGSVTVDVPGGRLRIDVSPTRCRLAGPAVIVATGTISPNALDSV